MAFALVGSVGTAVQSTSGGALNTLAWGTSETRAANNLLLCFNTVTGSATLPATPSGWSIGAQVAGTSCSATVFYKIAAGSDAAPTFTAITSGLQAGHLEEWSGGAFSNPLDKTGTATGTSSPTTATLSAANEATNGLVAMAGADRRSVARSPNDTWTSNHGTPTLRASNNAVSSTDHYSHATLISNSVAAADTAIQTLSVTTSITGLAVAAVSFRLLSTQTVTLGLLDASAALYAPTIYLDQFLTVPLLTSSIPGYSTTVLGDSPYAYWRLGESAGSTAVNAQGTSARDGTLVGGNNPPTKSVTGLLTGDSDTAYSFPNADFPAVQVAGVASIFGGTSSFSIESWVNHTGIDGSFRYIFDVESSANVTMAILQSYNGGLYFSRKDSGSGEDFVNPTPALSAGVHHVVATYDGSNMRVYVDGAQVGSTVASTRTAPTGTQAAIGNHSSSLGVPFNGTLDEVAVYSSALSLSTIQAHYTSGTTTPASAPVLYAPTLVGTGPGPQTVTLGLLDASAALYAPTLAPQPVTLTVPLLDGAAALYAPTLATRNLISLGLLDGAAALYAPTVAGVTNAYETAVLVDSPSFLARMSVASGTLVDAIAGLVGTSSGTPTYGVTGPIAGKTAIDFDADADVFTFADHNNLDLGGTAFSIELWIARDEYNVTYQTALSKGTNAYQVGIDPDDHYFLAKDGVALAGLDAGFVLDSGWHHVVWTFATGSTPCKLYVDAIDRTSTLTVNSDPTFADNTAAFWIGDGPNDAHIGGKIAYVALYKSTLSSARVSAHYSASGGATGDEFIVLGLLDGVAALYAPTLATRNLLTVPLLDASATVYAPTLAQAGGALQSLTVPLLGGVAYSATVLADTPYGYWRLGEPSGTSATDASGNSRTGTYGGGVAPPTLGVTGLLAGDSNTAALWVGTNYSDVAVDSVATIFDGTKSWTIEAWVNLTLDGSGRYIFSATAPAPYEIAAITADSGATYVTRLNSAGLDQVVGSVLSSGTHHVVATYDGSNIRLYIDGALNGTPTASTRSNPTGTEASIGNHAPTQALPSMGTLDEVAVYSTALSGSTIAAHYAAGSSAPGAVLYAPTVVAGAATITAPLLDGAAALYAPTLVGGAVTLTVPLLDGASALYAPLLYLDQFLTVPLLDAAATVYAPTLVQAQFVTLPLLDGAATTYAPTVIKAPYPITVPLLDGAAALYAPVVGQGLTLPLLDASAALFAPTLTVGPVTLTVPLLDGAATTYAPTLASGSTLVLGLLDGVATLYAPTVIQAQFVTPPQLDASAALFAPTLLGKNLVSLGLIDGAAALYAPTLFQAQFVTLPLLDGVATLTAPTLITQYLITVPLLDGAAALYAPSLATRSTLTVPLLDAAAALYAPAIQPDQFLTFGTIYGGLGAPSFVDEFDSGSTLNASVWNATYTGGDPGYGFNSHFMGDNRQVTVQNGFARMTAQRVGGTVTGVASTDVVTTNVAHNFAINDPVSFYSLAGGAGLANFDGANFSATTYFIKTIPTTTTFTLSATVGGATKDFTTNITSGSCRLPFDRAYKSASFGSNGTFSQRYGTWEARVRYPKGQGVFPAFWMIAPGAVTTPPEFDIFEAFPSTGPGGSGYNYLSSGGNCPGNDPATGLPWSPTGYPAGGPDAPAYWFDPRGDLTLDWHVHTLVWTPTSMQLWIDGIDRGTYTNTARINSLPAMYPIFTFALGVGGVYVIDDGSTTPDTLTMDIDYIRVYAEAAGAVLFPPTVAAGPKMVTVPLLDGGAALYAPAIQPDQFLTVPQLDAVAAVYAPTLTVGAVTLTVPLLDGAATTFAPKISQTVALGLLDASAATYAPSLFQAQFVTLPLLDAAAAVYAPSIATRNLLTVPLLDGAATTYAPTLTVGPVTVTLPLLDGVATIYTPVLQNVAGGSQSISLGLVDGLATLYAPAVMPAQFVTLGLLDASALTFAPTLAQAQFVTLPLLDGAATTFAPSITTGAIGVTLPLLDAGGTTFAPSLSSTITLGLLDSGAALYAPTLLGKNLVTVPLLDASAAVFAPTLRATNTFALPLLDGGATTYAPSLLSIASGSFTANAIIRRITATSFTANAFVAGVGVVAFNVDAVIRRTQAASLTANAVVMPRFTANAVIRPRFLVNAVIKRTEPRTYVAQAIVKRTASATLTADAFLLKASAVSFTADAVKLKTASSSFTANAVIRTTRTGGATADAVLLSHRAGSLSANAAIRLAGFTFTANAIVRGSGSGSFSAAAYVVPQPTQFEPILAVNSANQISGSASAETITGLNDADQIEVEQMTLTFVQGDTAPAVTSKIVKMSDQSPIDLSGATIRFQMRKPDDRRFTVNSTATVVEPTTGEVRYLWAVNDLTVPGEYLIQWEVTYPDLRIQTTAQETVVVRRQ